VSGGRDRLIDVTRLVWRAWRGGKPTGVDRVCLAYLDHYRDRARAVVQRKGVQLVFSARQSDRLFSLLSTSAVTRVRIAAFFASALPTTLVQHVAPGTLYFNVGHTGLNEPTLGRWIARHQLRAVHLVHDLIPITHPETCRAGEAQRHRDRMDQVLLSASGIVANSQATLDDLTAFAAEQGDVMPPTLVAWISGLLRAPGGPAERLERPHFIALGTIEGRKNHRVLLDAWQLMVDRLGERTPILCIVGRRGWRAEEITRRLDALGDLSPHVRELAHCGDDELARLIRGARAMLMPSQVEGFGLPVIEALHSGTPVIAADLPVYREIVGDLPTYLDPQDADAWASAIEAFTHDGPEWRRQLAAMADFRAPTWDEHFERVDSWAESLPPRFGRRLNA